MWQEMQTNKCIHLQYINLGIKRFVRNFPPGHVTASRSCLYMSTPTILLETRSPNLFGQLLWDRSTNHITQIKSKKLCLNKYICKIVQANDVYVSRSLMVLLVYDLTEIQQRWSQRRRMISKSRENIRGLMCNRRHCKCNSFRYDKLQ